MCSMTDVSFKEFDILLQKDLGLARQALLKEKQLFLETYHNALKKREMEWLENQTNLENDSHGSFQATTGRN